MSQWHLIGVTPDEVYLARTRHMVLGWFPNVGLDGDYEVCVVIRGRIHGEYGEPTKWQYLPEPPHD